MKPLPAIGASMLLGFLSVTAVFDASCRPMPGEWKRDEAMLAWSICGQVGWQLSFDTKKGEPLFNPRSVGGGPTLTNFRPEDHPWHSCFLFTCIFFNHVNYWEESRGIGNSEG